MPDQRQLTVAIRRLGTGEIGMGGEFQSPPNREPLPVGQLFGERGPQDELVDIPAFPRWQERGLPPVFPGANKVRIKIDTRHGSFMILVLSHHCLLCVTARCCNDAVIIEI
jgi:hypothetical protein